jgi:WD40 repeat protein
MRFISFSSEKYKYREDIVSLHFSPNSRTLAVVERPEEMVFFSWWDLKKQSEITFSHDDDIGFSYGYASDPVLFPDHRFLAYVNEQDVNSLRLVDRTAAKRSKKRVRHLTAFGQKKRSYIGGYLALRFSPDNRFLVAAVEADKKRSGIYRWSVEKILQEKSLKFQDHFLAEPEFLPIPESDYSYSGRNLIFSPDGTMLAVGLRGARVLLWEFPSGKELPTIKLKRKGRFPPAERLAFHPKSQILAIADRSIAFYDTKTAKRQIRPSADTPVSPCADRIRSPNAYDIEFHPSGHLLASVCGDSLVRWWDAKTGVEKETFDWEIGNVNAVAFSPDGCLCGAAGEKGIAIWDVTQ